jgi:hypothetical protein
MLSVIIVVIVIIFLVIFVSLTRASFEVVFWARTGEVAALTIFGLPNKRIRIR